MSKSKIRVLGVALLAVFGQSVQAVGTAPQNNTPTETPAKPSPAPATHEPPAAVVLPSGAKSATKLELDAIRTQNALATERAKAMGAASGMTGGMVAGQSVPAIDARPIPVESTSGRGSSGTGTANAANSARVTMVAGPRDQYAATIQTAQGLVVAHAGDRVPGLGTIRSISVNQVLVETGKGKQMVVVSLPFSAEPVSNLIQSGSPTPGNTNMPGAGQPFGGR